MSTLDPLRECISDFGSGLKYFRKALQHRHNSKIRKAAWKLSILCLLLHVIASVLAYFLPRSWFSTSAQLFYPGILLYRYIRPKSWDQLFINTVKSLGYSERLNIVAKTTPNYFAQLRRYCRRTFMAYLGVYAIQYLVNRTGILKIPSHGMALLAADQLLQYRGIKHSLWKLVAISLFVGIRWPIWVIQTSALQQLLIYELLQPYLARVEFKRWEERAWFCQHDFELQGFAFGAWLLCSIPWVGVGAIPFLFPAAAFFLTRSCGSLEDSGYGPRGDLIERINPGVKSVAHGKCKSVEGTWEKTRSKTFIRSSNREAFEPKEHSINSAHYSVDTGLDRPVTREQIETDKEASLLRKTDLYNQPRRSWDPRPPFDVPHIYRNSFFSTESSSIRSPASIRTERSALQEDFTKYNFSDRKTLASTPSAPPAPSDSSVIDSDNRFHQSDSFRVLPNMEMESSLNDHQVRAMETRKRLIEQIRAANEAPHRTGSYTLREESSASGVMERGRIANSTNEEQDEAKELLDEDEALYYNEYESSDNYIDLIYDQSELAELRQGSSEESDGLGNQASRSARRRGRGRGRQRGWSGLRGISGGRGYYRGGSILGRGAKSCDVDRDSRRGPGLTSLISQSVQSIEEQVGQLEDWSKQLTRRLRDTLKYSDNSRDRPR
ncbi:hypothetical protein BGX27_007799 [Mortierella sp. AM989]|nr:hypothetical protein BGX27_007799 [Mortierella sp. AM989]